MRSYDVIQLSKQDWKPYLQSLYIDLIDDNSVPPQGIHLGFKARSSYVLEYLKTLESIGTGHVILNLKFSSRPVDEIVEDLGEEILPHFN